MGSYLRNAIYLITGLINRAIFRLNNLRYTNITIRGILILKNESIISFGENSIINSSRYKNIIGGDIRSSIVVKEGARLMIGSNFRMSNSAIYCADNITIGNDVMIGGSCKIWDTDFHTLNPQDRTENPNSGYITKPITIGNNVFIGGFSIILKGTTIGDGSVVGAGSVVSSVVPPGEIWAGNPARFIRKLN